MAYVEAILWLVDAAAKLVGLLGALRALFKEGGHEGHAAAGGGGGGRGAGPAAT